MSDSPHLQHINIKLFINDPAEINLEKTIPLFHSWIQDQSLDDLLIDVADYRHVPSGPGVILVGHNAHYSFDNAEGELGILYNRKTVSESDPVEQLCQAADVVRTVCRMIAEDDAFKGRFGIATDRIQVLVNDRLLGTNDQEGFDRLLPDLSAALVRMFGEQDYEFERALDPRKRLSVMVRIPQGFTL